LSEDKLLKTIGILIRIMAFYDFIYSFVLSAGK
jgi:hypothetical protein